MLSRQYSQLHLRPPLILRPQLRGGDDERPQQRRRRRRQRWALAQDTSLLAEPTRKRLHQQLCPQRRYFESLVKLASD